VKNNPLSQVQNAVLHQDVEVQPKKLLLYRSTEWFLLVFLNNKFLERHLNL